MQHELMLMGQMTEQQRMMFMGQLSGVKKSGTAGVLLALFLGALGAHHFYLGRNGTGLLYLCFCWTFIPGVIALFECFLMPERVRRYNDEKATQIAQYVTAAFPRSSTPPPYGLRVQP